MTQEDLDAVIRARIRGLRLARGWSLDALAAKCHVSPSTLSRIETGQRRISIDLLVLIAQALDSSLDELVDSSDEEDVIIRPSPERVHGRTTWLLSRPDGPQGLSVAKLRLTRRTPDGPLRVHPGRDWLLVLSGTVRLYLGERIVLVEAGQAAQFNTMTPHAFCAHAGPAELLTILDHAGRTAHVDAPDLSDA